MATVESARSKYAAKTGPGSAAAAKYDAAKGRMVPNWTAGMNAFGMPPGPLSQQAYQQGIGRAQYRGGDPAKWERNMRDSLSR